ncbi:HET-domain-containing protein, partial [Stipitochalara longipes BDJ]
CTLHHDGCRKTLCSFPTRTLDVQDPHCIKLCNTEGQYGQYVALSHCWGGSNTFLTTPTTISAMCDGFSIDQLPLTFRDAVLVTRAFNQRYLWIDSLCIVQGDPQDWANESSKMADVFTNAYFTIGATNSECDTRGFLARPWRYILLNIVSSTSESAQVYLEADPLEAERFEPLYCRAWTLQEQYLSRRILHFCKHQVKVECCTGTLYETIPGFLFADKDTRCVVEDLRPILHNGLLSYAPWYRMISAFSNRSLTYDTDKLPALAGIASRVAEMANGKYCAGIWWDDLPQGLLWFRNSILKKPSKFLAPSWSWASANGSV